MLVHVDLKGIRCPLCYDATPEFRNIPARDRETQSDFQSLNTTKNANKLYKFF